MFRTIALTVLYALTRGKQGHEPIELPEGRPDMPPEDQRAFLETISKIRNAQSIRDEDRDPPPPWLVPSGAK